MRESKSGGEVDEETLRVISLSIAALTINVGKVRVKVGPSAN